MQSRGLRYMNTGRSDYGGRAGIKKYYKKKAPGGRAKYYKWKGFAKYKKKIPYNTPISAIKQRSIDTSAGGTTLTLNAGSYTYIDLTNITQDIHYLNRLTNNIRVKKIDCIISALNNSTVSRGMRVVVVGLRGSSNAADTTTWSDLLLDPSGFTKKGPDGNPFDRFSKINKDEYKLIFDKTYSVAGTSDQGSANIIHTQQKIKMNNLVQYVADSTDVRYGRLWMVIFCFEETGTTASASTVVIDYAQTTYFCDVI